MQRWTRRRFDPRFCLSSRKRLVLPFASTCCCHSMTASMHCSPVPQCSRERRSIGIADMHTEESQLQLFVGPGTALTASQPERAGPAASFGGHLFDRISGEQGIEQRLTKPNHPWREKDRRTVRGPVCPTNGQGEWMIRAFIAERRRCSPLSRRTLRPHRSRRVASTSSAVHRCPRPY